jgi:hypothetical protein
MSTHETNTGEGGASVTCHYSFDSDGDLDGLIVMMQGIDIRDALSDQQLAELEDKCRAAAKADYEETKDDSRIDAYIYERDSA